MLYLSQEESHMSYKFSSAELSFFGSILVAIITLSGTYIINNRQSKNAYKSDYRKFLITQKAKALEDIFSFLNNFMTVTKDDGWYTWADNENDYQSLKEKIRQVEDDSIWFPIEFKNMIIKLTNDIGDYYTCTVQYNTSKQQAYQSSSPNTPESFLEEYKKYCTYKDMLTDQIRCESRAIEISLYKYLADETNLIDTFKNNIKVLSNPDWYKKFISSEKGKKFME